MVLHMLNEQDITKICKEICEKAGYNFTIPVKINKRLTRTLGRVTYFKLYHKLFNGILLSTFNYCNRRIYL